jgi:signal peptidase II
MAGAAVRNTGPRWLWLSVALIAADRATKFAIERYTSPIFRRRIISDIVVLVHRQNSGIAFSIFSGLTTRWLEPILLLTSTAVIALMVWMLMTDRVGGQLAQCGVAMILAGAAGNALDRVLHGMVTDFLEVRLGSYIWPAFNVADSAITVGAILVGIELIFGGRPASQLTEKTGR